MAASGGTQTAKCCFFSRFAKSCYCIERLCKVTQKGYKRRIDDVIPTEQRKRGYKRRIGIVIPMNAENAWIWQVETNVNLKKAGIL